MILHRDQENRNLTLNLKINDELIEQVPFFEYLGLTIQNLKWNIQISKICTKISRISGVIHRIGNSVHKQTLISIYYATCRVCHQFGAPLLQPMK